jgi:hypothetical protein
MSKKVGLGTLCSLNRCSTSALIHLLHRGDATENCLPAVQKACITFSFPKR